MSKHRNITGSSCWSRLIPFWQYQQWEEAQNRSIQTQSFLFWQDWTFFVSDFCSWRDYMKTEKRRFFFFMGVEKWKTLSSGLHFFLTQAVHLKKEQKNQKSQWMISLLVVLHYIQKRIGSGPQVLLSINRLFIFFHTCCFVSVRKEPYSCKLQIESRWKIDCFCLEKAHFLTYSQQQAHM